MQAEVVTSPKVVWVNDPAGGCIGRFSVHGIDIHRTTQEQMEGEPECLACSHTFGTTTEDDWQIFRMLMMDLHSVYVPDNSRPGFLRAVA